MKKSIFMAAVACTLLLTSCGSIQTSFTSATKIPVATAISSENVADLEVGPRASLRYATTAEDRRAGVNNCKNAAVAALLKANGNADVLVSPEYSYDSACNYVEVSGRPAKYKNFRSAN